MAERRGPNRPYGSVKDRVNLFSKVDPALKAKLDDMADYLGISMAQALEAVLENVKVDANGRPDWYSGPDRPRDGQGELPLASAS